MALMRVRAAAQLTLPAEVRKALNVKEGDYLEAEIVEGGVFLKPVAVVERERSWQRLEEATSRVRDLKPNPATDNVAEEKTIAAEVKKARARRKKHA